MQTNPHAHNYRKTQNELKRAEINDGLVSTVITPQVTNNT